MQLIELLKKEDLGRRREIVILASVSGLANAFILAILNAATEIVNDGEVTYQHFFMFIIALALYVFSLRWTFELSSDLVETIIHKIRVRLAKKIRATELDTIESVGKAAIYNRLTQETEVISQSQHILILSMQSAVMVVFASFYVFILSPIAFFMIVVLILASITYYLYQEKETFRYLRMASEREIRMLGLVSHLLDGFKQVKMRKALGDDLIDEIDELSEDVRDKRIHADAMFNKTLLLEQIVVYLVLVAVVFILPLFIASHQSVISELTASVLFLVGPLSAIVTAIPIVSKADAAAGNIFQLEHTLDQYNRHAIPRAEPVEDPSFKELTLEGIRYAHRDADGHPLFQVGPLDFTIKGGEVLFIIGGNGSGKSTFLKLLTGLYQPDSGGLRLDGEALTEETLQSYRERFSIIFGDFHLFDKLYGLDGVTRDRVLEILKDMELTEKTDYHEDTGFTKLNLSTGQRKRIALLVAILEDRPIYVFDEWAADQDPHFRKHFYEDIIPGLAAMGKTVISVTHHDHFFHLADRVIKMDYGKLQVLES